MADYEEKLDPDTIALPSGGNKLTSLEEFELDYSQVGTVWAYECYPSL